MDGVPQGARVPLNRKEITLNWIRTTRQEEETGALLLRAIDVADQTRSRPPPQKRKIRIPIDRHPACQFGFSPFGLFPNIGPFK